MTKPLDSLKLDLILSISQSMDRAKLESLADSLNSATGEVSLFDLPPAKVEPIPSFDELFQAQGSKRITYDQLPPDDGNWEYSLDQLLAAV